MVGRNHFGRLWIVVLTIATTAPLTAHSGTLRASATSPAEVCTWQGANSLWNSSSNWSCGHVPTDADDVVIGAAGSVLVLSSSTTVNSVSLSDNNLTVNTIAVLNVNGTFTAQGDATVTVSGAISMTLLQVTTGTVRTNGTWNGNVEIALPAKLTLQSPMTVPGDIVVYGTLDEKPPGGYTLFFGGSVFRNDGAVRVSNVRFNRLGEQTIAGSGEWSGAGEIRTKSGSITSLADDLTLDTELYIEGDSSVDLGGHTLTMNGTSLYSMCQYSEQPSRLSGTGLLRTQGSMPLEGCAQISPDLEVASGTTTVSATPAVFNGTVSVLGGAALEVTTAFVTVHGDVTVTGTLTGGGADVTVTFKGDRFTNNGVVTIGNVKFEGAAQTLMGEGHFAISNLATVRAGTTLTLGSDHQMGQVLIETMGTLDLDHHTLGLTGDFRNQGTFHHGSGTVTFDGTALQAIEGSTTTFANLVISNTSGVSLTTGANVTGTLTLDGDLFTGDNVLTTSGTSAGAFDVFGQVRRSDLALGVARSFGSPFVTLTINSGTPPSEVTVMLSQSPPEQLPAAVQRSYTIAATGGSGYAATVRLHYRDSELNGLAEDELCLWKSAGESPAWRLQPKAAWDETDNWVEASGVTSFSDWALAVGGGQVYLPLVVR